MLIVKDQPQLHIAMHWTCGALRDDQLATFNQLRLQGKVTVTSVPLLRNNMKGRLPD